MRAENERYGDDWIGHFVYCVEIVVVVETKAFHNSCHSHPETNNGPDHNVNNPIQIHTRNQLDRVRSCGDRHLRLQKFSIFASR